MGIAFARTGRLVSQGNPFDAARLLRAALVLLLTAVVAACSVDNRPSGGLVVRVETDLAVPKDLDRIRVEIKQGGTTFLEQEHAADSADTMPWDTELSHREVSGSAQIRVVGYSGVDVRVERSAVVTVPSSRWATLHMRLSYLCLGTAACESGSTCVHGECVPEQVPESSLPDHQPKTEEVAGSRAQSVSSCFDVIGCFANASEADLDDTCAFEVNGDLGASDINVALRLPPGNPGSCGETGCYVPLEEGDEGYAFEPGRIRLPKIVCQRRQEASPTTLASVVYSSICPAKISGVSSCAQSEREAVESDQASASVAENWTRIASSAVGPACAGGRARACGMCGTQSRDCGSGSWTEFGACGGEGECRPEETRSCGTGGQQTCGGDCRWGACLGQTCNGLSSQACERCGTQARSCDNGIWNPWGACSQQGACSAGETRRCGSQGTQACGGDCSWGPCGDQICEGAPTEACGMCGTRTRQCDAGSGKWSEFGACAGEGACMPNQTRACGRGGVQVCGGNCQWSAQCTGQRCEGESAMACGNCGTRTRTCDTNTGEWSDWSACTGAGVCAPNQTRGCGRGGTQVCNGSCQWDAQCSGQSCVGPAQQSCGNCGSQTRTCDGATGSYSEWSSCGGQGACQPNAVRGCGSGGTQVCSASCQWDSACNGQVCSGPTSQACGNCGLQTRACNPSTGQLSGWGDCQNQGACRAGSTRACGSQGTQTCADNCQWSNACTGQVCAEPAERSCGNCGRQTSRCDTSTGQATWSVCMGEGSCRPGQTEACGAQGSHTCSASCQWPTTCSQQMCLAPRPIPATCGRCGQRLPICNPDSGQWGLDTMCSNEGACTPGQTRTCPSGLGTQTCNENCEWAACMIECTAPLTMPCGNCGVRTGTCDRATGQVTYGACQREGVCMPGASASCQTSAGAMGTHLCTSQCSWPNTCDAACADTSKEACGNCGTRSGTCDGNTGVRACVEPTGAVCKAGATQSCQNTTGSGTQTCDPQCHWQTCEITMRACNEPTTTPCGPCNLGTRSGDCDPVMGLRACVVPASVCTPDTGRACEIPADGGSRPGVQSCTMMCNWSMCAERPLF